MIENAGTLLGPTNLLAKVKENGQKKVELSADLEEAASQISATHAPPLVMLASGDPLFYGTARFLCDRFGKERFEVLPHVSSMQLAFARVKESWDEAFLTNLTTQSLNQVVQKVRVAEKVGVFTSVQAPPASLARALLDQGIDYFTGYICENIGSPDERVTRGSMTQIAGQTFSDLNVMILIRDPDVPDRPAPMRGRKLFGNPDQAFLQARPSRVLLTPKEIRVLALAEMDLGTSSIVWDVGAGSGSVAIEASQIADEGHVFAIEMDPEDFNLLIENTRAFQTGNLTPVLGEAPEAWSDLPAPDAIFVDGSGRAVTKLVEAAWARLKNGGRLVASVSSLNNLLATEQSLREHGADPQVLMVNISRGTQQLDSLRLESLNPNFLLTATKSVG